jgi:hypothetical protein
MRDKLRWFLVGLFAALVVDLVAQGSLSSQVLRLLDRANTWSLTQTFTLDPQFAAIHTGAPTSGACDAAGETGKIYWDSTNDILWLCSGASGWRQIATAAP